MTQIPVNISPWNHQLGKQPYEQMSDAQILPRLNLLNTPKTPPQRFGRNVTNTAGDRITRADHVDVRSEVPYDSSHEHVPSEVRQATFCVPLE